MKLVAKSLIIFSVFILALLIFKLSNGNPDKSYHNLFSPILENLHSNAQAQAPQTYTSSYNTTNFYANYALQYSLTNLSTSTEYTWSVQLLNEDDTVSETVFGYTFGPGATSTSFSFSNWPTDETRPVRVVDQYGQVLGRHFLAPIPHDDWHGTAGVNATSTKIGIGAAPYTALSSNDYHHDPSAPDGVTTKVGDYTLFHYNCSGGCGTDRLQAKIIGTADTVFTLSLAQIVSYNIGTGWTGSTSSSLSNFIVLNTGASRPIWVDAVKDAASFTGGTGISNPHKLNITTPQALAYAKVNASDVLVNRGESLWLITDASSDFEWQVKVKKKVISASKLQTLSIRAKSETIWNGFYDKSVYDSCLGAFVSDDIDAFDTLYQVQYTVDNDVEQDCTGSVYFKSDTVLPYSGSQDIFYFLIGDSYRISRVADTIIENIDVILDEWGLDSVGGHMLILIFLNIIFMAMATGLKLKPIFFSVLFVGTIVMTMLFDWWPRMYDIILALLCVVVLWFSFNFGNKEAADA